MNSFYVVVVVCLASMTLALPYDIAEDENGQVYYLVPLHRERRQTKIDLARSGPGVRATVSHQGTIHENNDWKVNGGGFASKQFHPSGPLTVGGNVGATHRSGSGLNLGASHTRRLGTDVGVRGNLNLYNANRGNTRLDAVGSYLRHFGGPYGTGRPNGYGGLQFSHQF